jgi:hypothetical protein
MSSATDSWHDVHARARVVHILACGGAEMDELARLADHDPAVAVAAIAYDRSHPREHGGMPRQEVSMRLFGLLRALAPQVARPA